MKVRVSSFTVYITKALGRHRSLISVVTSATLALTSFFYIYTLASYFKVGISVLRIFYNHLGFFDLYILSRHIDHIIIAFGISIWFALSIEKGKAGFVISVIYSGLTIMAVLTKLYIILDILALLSVPLLILLLACNRFVTKKRILNKDVDTDLSTNYIVITGLVISIAGLIASLTALFFTISSTSTLMRNYAHELFVLFSSFFSPILMTLLILCFPVKLLFNRSITAIKSKIKNNNNNNNNKSQYVSKERESNNKDNRISTTVHFSTISRTKIIFCLSFFMVLSATMALIPHLPAVNKDNRPIGTDNQNYVIAIKNLSLYSNNPQKLLQHAFVKERPFYGDRPISLLLLFTVVKIMSAAADDPTYVIDYMPIILGPAIVLAMYFLAREMTSNDTISILAAFITAISFQVLIGIYAAFYANWFALIIGYLSFVFLFKFLKKPSRLNFITYSVLVILLLLSHVYTWSIVAIVTGIFLMVMLKLNYYRRKNVILLLLVILSPAVIDIIRTSITGSVGGISFGVQFSQSVLSLKHFVSFRHNLLDTTQYFLGGLFGNFIIMALGLYWLFRANLVEPYNIFIMIFLSIGIVPLFFGDWILQSRVFYNIPFQIPAAIALNYIIKQPHTKGTMILFPICIWLLAISIVAVSNFYPICLDQFKRPCSASFFFKSQAATP
jgi:hypothetical protein